MGYELPQQQQVDPSLAPADVFKSGAQEHSIAQGDGNGTSFVQDATPKTPDTKLGNREVRISECIDEGKKNTTRWNKISTWFGNLIHLRGTSWDKARHTAEIKKIAEHVTREIDTGEDAGDVMSSIADSAIVSDPEHFGIFMEVMGVIGGDKLGLFKSSIGPAAERTFATFKDSTPSEEVAENFCKNVSNGALVRGGVPGLSMGTLSGIIRFALAAEDTVSYGFRQGSSLTHGDVLQFLIKNPGVLKPNVVGGHVSVYNAMTAKAQAQPKPKLTEASAQPPEPKSPTAEPGAQVVQPPASLEPSVAAAAAQPTKPAEPEAQVVQPPVSLELSAAAAAAQPTDPAGQPEAQKSLEPEAQVVQPPVSSEPSMVAAVAQPKKEAQAQPEPEPQKPAEPAEPAVFSEKVRNALDRCGDEARSSLKLLLEGHPSHIEAFEALLEKDVLPNQMTETMIKACADEKTRKQCVAAVKALLGGDVDPKNITEAMIFACADKSTRKEHAAAVGALLKASVSVKETEIVLQQCGNDVDKLQHVIAYMGSLGDLGGLNMRACNIMAEVAPLAADAAVDKLLGSRERYVDFGAVSILREFLSVNSEACGVLCNLAMQHEARISKNIVEVCMNICKNPNFRKCFLAAIQLMQHGIPEVTQDQVEKCVANQEAFDDLKNAFTRCSSSNRNSGHNIAKVALMEFFAKSPEECQRLCKFANGRNIVICEDLVKSYESTDASKRKEYLGAVTALMNAGIGREAIKAELVELYIGANADKRQKYFDTVKELATTRIKSTITANLVELCSSDVKYINAAKKLATVGNLICQTTMVDLIKLCGDFGDATKLIETIRILANWRSNETRAVGKDQTTAELVSLCIRDDKYFDIISKLKEKGLRVKVITASVIKKCGDDNEKMQKVSRFLREIGESCASQKAKLAKISSLTEEDILRCIGE
jgi:hypothetical protein